MDYSQTEYKSTLQLQRRWAQHSKLETGVLCKSREISFAFLGVTYQLIWSNTLNSDGCNSETIQNAKEINEAKSRLKALGRQRLHYYGLFLKKKKQEHSSLHTLHVHAKKSKEYQSELQQERFRSDPEEKAFYQWKQWSTRFPWERLWIIHHWTAKKSFSQYKKKADADFALV